MYIEKGVCPGLKYGYSLGTSAALEYRLFFLLFSFSVFKFYEWRFFFYYCIVLVETENTFVGLIFTIILSHISFP